MAMLPLMWIVAAGVGIAVVIAAIVLLDSRR